MAEYTMADRLTRGALAFAQGITKEPFLSNYDDTRSSFEALKQRAEQWKNEQQTKLVQEGWLPVEQFPGGNPADFQAINTPAGGFYKAIPAGDKVKGILENQKLAGLKAMTPEQQIQYALGGGAGKESGPTWSQQQKVSALKAGLNRGKVVLGKEFGEPSNYQIKSLDDAISAITEAGLDPSMFTEDLDRYQPVLVKDTKGKTYSLPKYQLPQLDKKKFTIVE